MSPPRRLRARVQRLVCLPREDGYAVKIGIIHADGREPRLSLGAFCNDEWRARIELRPQDLPDVRRALDAFEKTVLAHSRIGDTDHE